MTPLPRPVRALLGRIAEFWVYGTLPTALLLLMLAPILLPGQTAAIVLAYLALPAYMIHQVEEHDADRFRTFVNRWLGPSYAGLSIVQVAIINLGLVWLPLAATVGLTALVDPGWAAIAAWLMLVNATAHVAQGVVLGGYNPGLVTAGVLFLPLGIAILVVAEVSTGQHVIALAITLVLHAAIVVAARRPAPKQSPDTPADGPDQSQP
ncbi:MAG: HXXEE domain-containing protein [Pseudomonadota bacterium]